jgi:intein/homing endonuclease
MKRNLTPEEISDICSVVKPSPFLSPDVIECITDNLTNNIKRQLKSIQIYPQNIPKLKEQIELYYERSRIDPSESVGCIAASSIGADTTQASLNSVEWNTRVIIDKDGKTVDDTIGNLIDTEFKLKGYTTVVYSGQIDENIKNENNPYAQVLDTTDKEWFIPSVDKHGNTSWKKITQLIRHPLYTGLIKVTTSNGRTVTATTGLSFLTKQGNEIVPTLGSDLKVGDELPIAWKIPRPNVIQTQLHLKDYLSPLEYIYGNDLWRAKEIRDEYISQGYKRYRWWEKHNGIDFQLPFTRSDTAMESIEGVRKSKIGKEDILKGYIYNHVRSSAKNLIPEYIPLDEDFGFFIGAYIAEGCSSDNYIVISNYDEKYLKRIENLMTKWGVKTHYTNIGYKYIHMNKYEEGKGREVTDKMKEMENNQGNADIRIHSTLLNTFIEKVCGKGSLNKHLPNFVYNAPDDFIRGLLDALFSGDGHITDEINYSTISYRLSDGLIKLLSMLNIYVSKSKHKPSHNNKGSEIINEVYYLKITGKNINRFYEFVKDLTIDYKIERLKILVNKDKVHNIIYQEKKGTLLNDTVFSKIKSIEVVDTPTYVYDFTVDETKTFIIQGNLNMMDSFHSSGISKANLTGGLVRQNELLNASKRVKTPSCTFNLNKDMIDSTDLFKVKEFCNSNIRYYEIQDMLKDIEIDHNPTIDEKDEKYYSFFADTFDDTFRECEWRVKLLLNKDALYKIKKDLMYITCCIYSCIDEVRQYLSIIFFPDDTGRIDIWIKHENILDPEVFIASSKKKKIDVNEEHKDVINSIINYNNKVLKFIKHILIPTMNFVPISGIFGIEDCYYTEEKGGEWRIDTKGSNYKELILQPYVDFKRCKSNNMWDNFEVLGIEGAHRYLLEEFSEIIKVNKRHLDILIDSMTNPGKIMSVSRYGIDRKQVGPLAKACFEQPIENFLISASKGEIDDISGVTASITLGKLSRIGTGSMDLIVDTKKMFLTPNVYGEGNYSKEIKEAVIEELSKEDDDFEDMDIVGEEEDDFTY